MININLFGGPGLGKSTSAAGLFYQMKIQNYKVEFIPEYAKELTYGNDYTRLSDQLHILGEQHHRMFRLRDKVDFLIHDSPFLMGLTYLRKDDPHLPSEIYESLVVEMFNSYDNLNIFLVRNDKNVYQEYGRSQSLSEAIDKDIEIKNLLNQHKVKHYDILASENTIEDILHLIDLSYN